MDNFDLKKYLAEGKLHKEVDESVDLHKGKVNEIFQTYDEMFKHFYDKAIKKGMTPEEAKKDAEENMRLFAQKMDENTEGKLTNEGIFSRKKEPSISDKFYGGMDKEDYKRLSNENSDLYAQLKEKYSNNPQQLADDMYEALSGNASSEKELNAAFKSML